jgi:hypothetical protein
MLVDAIIGIIPRSQLPEVLTQIHRSGLGPQARVLDPERGPLDAQLARAGVIDAPSLQIDQESETLLLVFSAGRMSIAIEAMQRFGGREIQTLARRTSLQLPVNPAQTGSTRSRRAPKPPVITRNETAPTAE